ncbi:DNA-processing protein DprA [Actinoallomurus acanthiterrae]
METTGKLFPTPEHAARAILTVLAEPANAWLGRRLAHEPAVDVASALLASPVGWASERAAQVLCDPAVPDAFARGEGRFVIPGDPEWPTRVDLLGARRPYGLWVKCRPGRLAALAHRPSVSIIGSRDATDYGVDITARLVRELTGSPWVTVAGGARGIDRVTGPADEHRRSPSQRSSSPVGS